MDFIYNRSLKVISVITLLFFMWTFELSGIAYAIKNAQKAIDMQDSKAKPEQKFGQDIEGIENILKDISTDTDTKKSKLKAKRAEIEADDIEIKKTFAATEKTLQEKGLPPEILERHRKFVKRYEDNLSELKTNLANIEKAKTRQEADTEIDTAKAHLEKVRPPKRKPIDPTRLPHRIPEEKQVILEEWKAPEKPQIPPGFLKKADLQNHKPVLVAANGPLDGLLSHNTEYTSEFIINSFSSFPDLIGESRKALDARLQTAGMTTISGGLPSGSYQLAMADPPTDADLAEDGIEIVFTPAIRAKAAELGYKPVQIYNWVRNNIEFVPTYGSIQGADMCLQTKQCNAYDTSSLLIALLRVSGIYARYAYGTVEIPAAKVQNWLGNFATAKDAANLLASAGIPVKAMIVGNDIKYIRIETVWVEAFVDYIPSRGARHKVGDTFIPLDPSFKQCAHQQLMIPKSEKTG